MRKKSDLSLCKIGQAKVLWNEIQLKKNAPKIGVSTQIFSVNKKKFDSGTELGSRKVGRYGRKRKPTWRTDRQVIKMALENKRASCRNISAHLKEHGISLSRRRVTQRLQERNLRAYRPTNKPRMTQPLMEARVALVKNHINWTSEQWEKVNMILNWLIQNL